MAISLSFLVFFQAFAGIFVEALDLLQVVEVISMLFKLGVHFLGRGTLSL